MGLLALATSIVLLVVFVILALPAMVLGAVLGAALFLVAQIVLLPFRLLGWSAGPGAGLILGMAKLFLLFLAAVFVMAGLVVGFLPLIPLLLLVAGVWLILRPALAGRSRHAEG
ncbi:MAG TPA: hypothetical protein VJV23_00855 [Candidatus Polarisedimenticolia bacterium]|nr:hypothetical protein [Candidatus Polarisedimenticolia bacterium]